VKINVSFNMIQLGSRAPDPNPLRKRGRGSSCSLIYVGDCDVIQFALVTPPCWRYTALQ